MNSVTSIYRQSLRQASYLPHPYLQAFAKARVRDYFRRHRNEAEPLKYLKRARADLRQLEGINCGSQRPFMQLLRQAYGRTGRLKRELLLPHLADQDPYLPQREPIIPGVEESRPPSYTRTLLALVSSPISRRPTKATPTSEILWPRTLPERADPNSEAARLLGPLSLRRTKNIHHRFYAEQTGRVIPPLEVRTPFSTEEQAKQGLHIPQTGLEALNPIEMLVKLATPPPSSTSSSQHIKLGNRTARWLRRRYRELLSEIPSINVVPHSIVNHESSIARSKALKLGKKQEYSSRIESIPNPETPLAKVHVGWSSPLALTDSVAPRLREVTQSELEWITKPVETDQATSSKSTKSSRKKTSQEGG